MLRGHLDVPLDHVGRRQARALGELFASVDVAAIITSPLQRARQTAHAIAATTGTALEEEPRLVDRDYRAWTGQDESILRSRYGSVDAAPDVEPLDAFTHRTIDAISDLAARFAGRRVVVVAHDAVNRHVPASLVPSLGPDPSFITQRPGSWNRLERTRDSWAAPVVDAIPGEAVRP
jgi:probable phosphoglycerate mutase